MSIVHCQRTYIVWIVIGSVDKYELRYSLYLWFAYIIMSVRLFNPPSGRLKYVRCELFHCRLCRTRILLYLDRRIHYDCIAFGIAGVHNIYRRIIMTWCWICHTQESVFMDRFKPDQMRFIFTGKYILDLAEVYFTGKKGLYNIAVLWLEYAYHT